MKMFRLTDGKTKGCYTGTAPARIDPVQSTRGRRSITSQFTTELRSELYSSPQTHMPVEKIASRVNLSKSYFQHIYKELFGCSVVSDIIQSRLEYAKYLLVNSVIGRRRFEDVRI